MSFATRATPAQEAVEGAGQLKEACASWYNDWMSTSSHTHTVLYHGRCADGLGAAWAVREILGDKAEYIPMEYDTSPPDVTGREVVIVDFSFKPMTMRILEEQATSVTLLDHHDSAQKMLADYQCLCGTTHMQFDMHRSGAMMAWNHFHPGKEPPPLIHHIQDRDIWTWKDPNSQPFLRQLDTMPMTFESYDQVARLNEHEFEAFVEKGKGLCEQFDGFCKGFVDIAQPLNLDGIDGTQVATSFHFTSEVGNMLARKTGTFACMWYIEKPGTVKVGLRAVGDTDVSAIAVRFGGGGHKHAAAFRMSTDRLPELVAGKLMSPLYAANAALGDSPSV